MEQLVAFETAFEWFETQVVYVRDDTDIEQECGVSLCGVFSFVSVVSVLNVVKNPNSDNTIRNGKVCTKIR